jgi:hypothetical protein
MSRSSSLVRGVTPTQARQLAHQRHLALSQAKKQIESLDLPTLLSTSLKLSQIAPASLSPALSDQIVGVKGGVTDQLYTAAQVFAALAQVASSANPPAVTDKLVGLLGGTTPQLYTAAQLIAAANIGLVNATADVNLYVDTVNGNDNNTGTNASPFASLQHAMFVAASYNYNVVNRLYIWLKPGSVTSTFNIGGSATGVSGIFFPTLYNCYQAHLMSSTGIVSDAAINLVTPTNGPSAFQFLVQVGQVNWFIDGLTIWTQSSIVNSDVPNSSVSLGAHEFGNYGVLVDFNHFGANSGVETALFISAAPSATTYLYNVTFGGVGNTLPQNILCLAQCQAGGSIAFGGPVTFTVPYVCEFLFLIRGGGSVGGWRLASINYNSGNITSRLSPGVVMGNGGVMDADIDPTNALWNGVVTDPSCFWGDRRVSTFGFPISFQAPMAVIKSVLPANTDIPQSTYGVFKDTSGGGVYLAYNDGGTIKKVALV